ncbi:MAG: sodium-dependent transporter, partial [Arcobacter sp.]
AYGTSLTFFGKNAFDWMDFLSSSISMPLAGIVTCIFLGYYVDKQLLQDKFTKFVSIGVFNIWYALIKYIVPIAIAILLFNKLGLI